jgi:hypothetical protein
MIDLRIVSKRPSGRVVVRKASEQGDADPHQDQQRDDNDGNIPGGRYQAALMGKSHHLASRQPSGSRDETVYGVDAGWPRHAATRTKTPQQGPDCDKDNDSPVQNQFAPD